MSQANGHSSPKYPPSPIEENLQFSPNASNDYNFASKSKPFYNAHKGVEELLDNAHRVQSTSNVLDRIEQNQNEIPQLFNSLNNVLQKEAYLDREISQVYENIAVSTSTETSRKLAKLQSKPTFLETRNPSKHDNFSKVPTTHKHPLTFRPTKKT
jgi:hypothetical protein